MTKRRWLQAIGIYLVFAAAFGLTIGSLNLPKYYRLHRNGKETVGTVTSTDCAQHSLIRYSFDVDGQKHGGQGTGDCPNLAPGAQLEVWYLPEDPSVNVLYSASSRFWNECISVGMVMIFPPAIITAFFMWRLHLQQKAMRR